MFDWLALDGPSKKEDDGGIEFEGVHIDDDPTTGMVVMRGFLFLPEDGPQMHPAFKIDSTISGDNGSSVMSGDLNTNSLTTQTNNKSSRRVTLFEGKRILFSFNQNFLCCLISDSYRTIHLWTTLFFH